MKHLMRIYNRGTFLGLFYGSLNIDVVVNYKNQKGGTINE